MLFSPPLSLSQCASGDTPGKHRGKERGAWISYDLKETGASRGEWGFMDGACHVLARWDSGRSGPRLLCGGSDTPGPWCGSGYGDWPGPAGIVLDTAWTTMTRSKKNRRWCALRYGLINILLFLRIASLSHHWLLVFMEQIQSKVTNQSSKTTLICSWYIFQKLCESQHTNWCVACLLLH